MKTIRQISLMIIGSLMIYMAFRSEYESSFLDAFFILGLIFSGAFLFSITADKELSAFKKEKSLQNFTFTLIFLASVAIAIFKTVQVKDNFNKPTLLKAHYDGDYNATAIDFKTDSTFRIDDSAISFSSYTYGTYTISGNSIKLKKASGDGKIPVSSKLKICEVEMGNDSIKKEKLLFEVNNSGEIIDKFYYFRITTDNRNYSK